MNSKSIACLAALTVAAVGSSQATKPVGLSVRAGILWPTSAYGRSVGNTWFGFGAEYKIADLPNATEGSPSKVTLSIDYYGKGEAHAVPVLVNFGGSSRNTYYSAGIGFSFTDDAADSFGTTTGGGGGGGGTVAPPGTGTGGGGTAEGGNTRKTNFCYSLALGYNFPSTATPFFVEARFFGHSRSAMNALGLYVGVRF